MYQFIKTPDADYHEDHTQVEIQIETNDVTYTELITEFENFLRACGFVFDGHVVMTEDDNDTSH